MIKLHLNPNSIISNLQVVVTGVQTRKASTRFDNAEDVKNYPYALHLAVIADKQNINLGQQFTIKLKTSGQFKVGQQLELSKFELINGQANLWADSRRYVQVSLKGDALNAR